MGYLCGCSDDDSSLFHIGKGDGRLYVAVLHALGPVVLLYLHQSLLLHCFPVSPFAHHKGGMGDDISRFFIVKPGGALCHGILHGQEGSILLILHLHKSGCPGCRYIVLRYNGCNIVSIDPHPGIEKFPVRNILMGRFHGPWMAGGGELDVRHIEARDNLHYPRHLQCFFQIKAFYHAVGDGAAYYLCRQKSLGL